MACRCGQVVYFDNHFCGACGRQLAYDPQTLSMVAEETPGSGLEYCMNRASASACNWLANSPSSNDACLSCQTNQIIPSLKRQKSRNRWRRLDAAKRRMLVDLLQLRLPIDPTTLRFEFKEDQRTNPNSIDEFVTTGHASGVITINAAEADSVYREEMRRHMNESWRTLLGHLRHESGHYYFNIVIVDSLMDEFRNLFGDERKDYAAALERHYQNGPPDNWRDSYVSHYASAHTAEDWAECWGHYLHIRAALVVAVASEFVADQGDQWLTTFKDLSVSLNEITRSLGLPDAYPFVLNDRVSAKIEFVHKAIRQFQNREMAESGNAV